MKDSKKDKLEANKNKQTELSYRQLISMILITTIAVMFAMGFSFSIFDATLDPSQNNIINTIIALFDKDDDKDKDKDKDNDNKDDDFEIDPKDIIFSYYEQPFVGNGIRLYKQYPISDETGKALEGEYHTFEFRLILNDKARGVDYYITAEKLINSDLRNDAVKIYLESDGGVVSNVVRSSGRIKTFNEFATFKNGNANEKLIFSRTITKEEADRGYKDFVFKMWISEDLQMTADDIDRTFMCRINVYGLKSK